MNEYTLQTDRHGNRIICKGDRVRNGYTITAEGTYRQMCALSAALMVREGKVER